MTNMAMKKTITKNGIARIVANIKVPVHPDIGTQAQALVQHLGTATIYERIINLSATPANTRHLNLRTYAAVVRFSTTGNYSLVSGRAAMHTAHDFATAQSTVLLCAAPTSSGTELFAVYSNGQSSVMRAVIPGGGYIDASSSWGNVLNLTDAVEFMVYDRSATGDYFTTGDIHSLPLDKFKNYLDAHTAVEMLRWAEGNHPVANVLALADPQEAEGIGTPLSATLYAEGMEAPAAVLVTSSSLYLRPVGLDFRASRALIRYTA